MDWQVFTALQGDDGGQLVDLISTIGTPFPRHTSSHSPPHHITASHPHNSHTPLTGLGLTSNVGGGTEPGHSRDGIESGQSGDGMESGQCGDEMEPGQNGDEVEDELEDPVVHVFLRGHEGVRADTPFSVHPTQMVGDDIISNNIRINMYICSCPLFHISCVLSTGSASSGSEFIRSNIRSLSEW